MLSPVSNLNSIKRKDIALLGAFCLFLSTIEYMIPKPLPFMRLGLANLPLLLALNIFDFKSFLILLFIKTLGQALITGTLFSYIFLFSLCGTILSGLTMFGLRRLCPAKLMGFVGIGAAGAFVSNLSQLALAYIFIFGDNTRYVAPPFLAAGIITGILLGIFCELFTRQSEWYRLRWQNEKV
ncbi:MAG: Gx transporter family protein [Spirochaetaceae bacterium]|jgi:heptaprenyl diphosphate synthase|nr:Gx transporter family protein [Spirochaetaceae bacterium]